MATSKGGLCTSAVDGLLARPEDNRTVELLLCETKNSLVDYVLRGQEPPMGGAEWTSQILNWLPSELAASLPSSETLETELSGSAQEDEA